MKKYKFIGLSILILLIIVVITIININNFKKAYVKFIRKDAVFQSFNKNGNLEGEVSIYKKGSLIFKGKYIDGKLDDWIIQYFDNGKIKQKQYYRNGIMEGADCGYYQSGKLEYVSNYRHNNYFGSGYHYTENDKLDTYTTTDLLELFFFSSYDKSGKTKQIVGNIFSEKIYSFLSKTDSAIILADHSKYKNISDLNIMVATPPTLKARLEIKINNKTYKCLDVKHNIIKILNVFKPRGSYNINIKGKLLNGNKQIIKVDSLHLNIDTN